MQKRLQGLAMETFAMEMVDPVIPYAVCGKLVCQPNDRLLPVFPPRNAVIIGFIEKRGVRS
jgi:hypothetical protein